MNVYRRALSGLFVAGCLAVNAGAMPLDQAIREAWQLDPWQQGQSSRMQATEARQKAAGYFPDPVFGLNLQNVPVDSFDLHQEAMTQTVLKVTQPLPRGRSLRLQQNIESSNHLIQQQESRERQAQVRLTVTRLWLESRLSQVTAHILEDSRLANEQQAEAVSYSYRSGESGSSQSKTLQSSVQLSQLDNRVALAQQEYARNQAALQEWLSPSESLQQPEIFSNEADPDWTGLEDISAEMVFKRLEQHPSVQILDRRISQQGLSTELVKQQLRPAFAINASYGFRQDDSAGRSRPDMVSAGISIELPLNGRGRVRQKVLSSSYEANALAQQRQLALRQMDSLYLQTHEQIRFLNKRIKTYREQIIPDATELAENTVNDFRSDRGSLERVMSARIALADHRINLEQLKTQLNLQYAQLQYLLLPPLEKDSEL